MSAPYASEEDRVRAALAMIPAEDYTTWIDMAFAIKNGFGDAGFELWDAWSRTARNYDAQAARTAWRSARESGGKTLASVFWLARQYGFDLTHARVAGNRFITTTRTNHGSDAENRRGRDRSVRHAMVAREALAIWRWARPVAPEHPYLVRKQIPSLPTLRELEADELHALLGYAPKCHDEPLRGRVLIVPVRVNEKISTLELIDSEGRKSALAGGAKAGGWWAVMSAADQVRISSPIMIAEGVATAVSAWQATGWFALAALSSGNLPTVAAAWRDRYPQAQIVVLADLGAGHDHALRAVQQTHGRLVEPLIAAGARLGGQTPSDFNDMAALYGIDAVGDILRDALSNTVTHTFLNSHAHVARPPGAPLALTRGNDMKRTDGTESKGAGEHVGADEAQSRKTGAGGTRQAPTESADRAAHVEHTVSTDSSRDRAAAAQRGSLARHSPGELLYGLDAVPSEIKALAEHRFGSGLRMATPRNNGGPYRGEVFNVEHYLIQEVGPRSVVFHAKQQLTFVSDRLRWMDEHQRLNGAEVQVVYDGEQPKVYPWDRARDQLERVVASLKKSAREIGWGNTMDTKLDELQAASWARMKAARAATVTRSRGDMDGRVPSQELER